MPNQNLVTPKACYEISDLELIKATGIFLMYYQSDLSYIDNFRKYRNKEITDEKFVTKETGSFYSFLIEFKVIRHLKAGECIQALQEFGRLEENAHYDVDKFAFNLRKLTEEKLCISLASKILFLNDPWNVIPYDKRAKKAVGCTENCYQSFLNAALKFQEFHVKTIQSSLRDIESFTNKIELNFQNLKNIEVIREKRFTDKLLWTIGK